MPQIHVANVVKRYRIAERKPGLLGAVGGLFRRRYRTVEALAGISFTAERGELLGYIGPNGAGKSTTVKILAGILVPDSGNCTVDGRTPWADRVAHAARIGVVFGQRTQLWWDLPVCESFDLLRDIYRVPTAVYRRTRRELVERLDLGALLATPVRQLSLGQRMRCDLAAAMLHEPDILFLDEPTIGLDAVAKLAVRKFVRDVNHERGVTVVLTTHDLDDIEVLCERVIVVGGGQVLCDGSLQTLRNIVGGEKRLSVDLSDLDCTPSLPPAVRVIERQPGRLTLEFAPSTIPAATVIQHIADQQAIRDLTLENLAIDEVIARYYALAESTMGSM